MMQMMQMMQNDSRISQIVERIGDAWPFPMSPGKKIEYEDRLGGLDPRLLHRAIDDLVDAMPDRPSINQIKLAYDRHRPAARGVSAPRAPHPYDAARQLAHRNRKAVLRRAGPLFAMIASNSGKGALRDYLQAASFVVAQGVVAAGVSHPPRLVFERIATGYLTWAEPQNDLHEARELFRHGRQIGRIEFDVPARAMNWFKSLQDTGRFAPGAIALPGDAS